MSRKSYKIDFPKCSGFSLIELMIAVVIVGILAT
ncbi:type IV pilin protein, partial [Xanthomonas fragariae]